jgi:hypothetical protein
MDPRSENLIRLLYRRFEYTRDNNRDLIGDPTFSHEDRVDEINVQWAWQYIVAHLTSCDPATDTACWGDD